jgi:GNAT superfamily N-acetyltransferase
MIKKLVKLTLFTMMMVTGAVLANTESQLIYQLEPGVTIKAFSGKAAKQYFPQIADIRINLFREYPYLYDGSYEYEREYLDTYFESPKSKILLVLEGDKVVGFSNSIPLSEELEEIQAPFIQQGEDLGAYLYIGEVMLYPKYRGKGLLRKFLDYHHARAKQLGYSQLTFMTVNRDDNHPSRPQHYQPLEPLWEHFGYKREKDMQITLPWKQIDTHKEESNYLAIWVKQTDAA